MSLLDSPAVRGLKRQSTRGFTLIEILVVIVVIAILASVVAPDIIKNVGDAKTNTAKNQIETLGTALDNYMLGNQHYPTTAQGLEALWTVPTVDAPMNWRGPYLRKPVPMDPWGRPYVYVYPGENNPNGYDLYTFGLDGEPGGEGENADVTSWQ